MFHAPKSKVRHIRAKSAGNACTIEDCILESCYYGKELVLHIEQELSTETVFVMYDAMVKRAKVVRCIGSKRRDAILPFNFKLMSPILE